jgi:N-methylhydantoinase B
VLTRRLAELPVNWRFFMKHQAFDELEARIAAGAASEGPKVIDDIFDLLVRRYPELTVVREPQAA